MQKEYLFKNLGTGNTIIKIDGNKLSIIRKGIRSFMNFGLKGEKTILLNQISAVQLKNVVWLLDIFNLYWLVVEKVKVV